MSASIIAIILSAAMLHAVWNAIVKTAVDRTTTLGLVALGHVLPGAVMVSILPLPSTESFIYIILSTLVHFAYFFLLGRAYQHGDLSVVYPIARGIVPALVSLWAMLLLGEVLPALAWVGIGLIIVGILLSNWKALRSGVGKTTLGLALGTGFCISIYSLVDGVGLAVVGHLRRVVAEIIDGIAEFVELDSRAIVVGVVAVGGWKAERVCRYGKDR